MALHKLEYDGKYFIIDDRLHYGVYVQRAGSSHWRVDVKPGVRADAVLSLDLPTPTFAEKTRQLLLQLIEDVVI